MPSYKILVEGGIRYPDSAKPGTEKSAPTGSVVVDLDPKWIKDGLALGYIEESKAPQPAEPAPPASAETSEPNDKEAK